jgi:flagellar basal body-associated protein FliL
MADTDETKQENPKEDAKDQKNEKKSLIKRILPIVIIIVIVGLCSGAGLVLGKMLAPDASKPDGTETEAAESDDAEAAQADTDSGEDSNKVWYYDFEPVVANLNEPSVARYVSLTITLQIGSELSEKEGKALIDEKVPILTDWLTVYLAGLSLDDIRGDKNLKSIQVQILEAFNEQLFPNSKPRIRHILFRNFAVQ